MEHIVHAYGVMTMKTPIVTVLASESICFVCYVGKNNNHTANGKDLSLIDLSCIRH